MRMASSASIDPSLRIGAVRLAVADLPRSADFYERVLGLPAIDRDEQRALFGADPAQPVLELNAITDPTPLSPHDTGLFHVAWLHPTRAALATSMRRVLEAGWNFTGASDHHVSEALYLDDPDGLGIELYSDRPPETWEAGPDGGPIKMVSLPLDVEDLAAAAPPEAQPRMDAGTHIGHVHLKVADVDRTAAFYTGALGLELRAEIPSAAFVAAGGYHHHLGLNSWESAGAARAPDDTPGLRRVRFGLSDAAAIDALEASLRDAPASPPFERTGPAELEVADPDGELLTFAAA